MDHKIYKPLMAYAMILTKNATDAEDLCHDTIIRSIEKKHQFEEGTNLKAWMHRIMYTLFINKYRRIHRKAAQINVDMISLSEMISDNSIDVLNELAAQDVDSDIIEALNELPEQFRDAITDYAELDSYKACARKRKIAHGTVMSRLSRGRTILKDRLRGKFGSISA